MLSGSRYSQVSLPCVISSDYKMSKINHGLLKLHKILRVVSNVTLLSRIFEVLSVWRKRICLPRLGTV